MTGAKQAIHTPFIFQELYCKQMIYFLIENTLKKKKTCPQKRKETAATTNTKLEGKKIKN